MAITITRRETNLNPAVPAGTTLANHTFSVDIGDIIINDTENKTLNYYTNTPTSGTIKYDNASGGRGIISDTFALRFYINGNYIRRATFITQANTDRGYALYANVLGTIQRDSYWWDGEHTVSDYFNENNKTSIAVPVAYRLHYCFLQTKPATVTTYGDVGYANYNDTTTNIGQINLRLDVPPTFDTTALSYTAPAYTGITTASVTVSNATAYYGGDIASATLTIGNQTETISGDGTISMLLNEGGTFTPKVTVTDSRGQKKVTELDPITVNVYNAPSATFTAQRTTQAGVADDEGTYAVISTTLTFDDAIATALAPTVAVMDENGTTTTPTVTWYTTRALTNAVTWGNVSSGDTVYGLVNGFNTQYSYQISVTPRDNKGTGTAITQTLASAFYTVDFLAGGHGIAFGKPASKEGFECAMTTSFLDMTPQEVSDFVDTIGGGGSPFADKVVEQGTSDIWTYRKWASGVAECWGTYTNTASHYATALGGYAYNSGNINFPSNLFISTPIVNYSACIGNGFALTGTRLNTDTKDKTILYAISTVSGSVTIYWYIYVIGRWE